MVFDKHLVVPMKSRPVLKERSGLNFQFNKIRLTC
jgi:hypothetical protein